MVICKKCNAIRDVDLCRDPDRLPSVDPDSGEMLEPVRKSWACHVSQIALNSGVIADCVTEM